MVLGQMRFSPGSGQPPDGVAHHRQPRDTLYLTPPPTFETFKANPEYCERARQLYHEAMAPVSTELSPPSATSSPEGFEKFRDAVLAQPGLAGLIPGMLMGATNWADLIATYERLTCLIAAELP
jgi:hypothetical protein